MEQQAKNDFEFRGNAAEWFGIWIVNLLLTILTLGIYSAWAKVRTNKYFYQNTYVADRNFDYHATGMQILIGRIIVVAALIVFNIILAAAPVFGLLLLVVLIFAFPALFVNAMKFNARMTSWSNVRFKFDGGYGQALLLFMVYPILVIFTFYIASPFLQRAWQRYRISNHSLGGKTFVFDAPIFPYYKALGVSLLWVVAVTLLFVIFGWNTIEAIFAEIGISTSLGDEPDSMLIGSLFGLFYGWVFAAFLPALLIYQANIYNVMFENTVLANQYQFAANISPIRYVWIVVSNLIVTVLSLGLMLPWAKVRLHRYLTEHTSVYVNGSLDDFISELGPEVGSIGQGFADIEGIDVGF